MILDTILKKIQDTVIKYANVLSELLKVDVEIVDKKLVRIAGTGEYKNLINENIKNAGNIYKKVLETGKSQVIENPGENELCIDCKMYKTCIEKFEMCVPIKMDDEILGIIGLICFKEEQKIYITENLDIYSSFLEQIADFISAKAFETIEKEKILDVVQLLKYITDKIGEGVIIFRKDGCINFANAKAQKILDISEEKLKNKKIKFKDTGKYILDKKEYKVILNNKSYYLSGEMNVITHAENMMIFVFDETENIKNQINELTDMADTVVFNNILGTSKKIMEAKNKIIMASKSPSLVLIKGESGVGKEIFARTIHKLSRNRSPFISINCELINEDSFDKELASIEKESTVFFDGVADMSPSMQLKLLKFLKNNEIDFTMNIDEKPDIRIIASVNKELYDLVEAGSFRKDLYYKLNVCPIDIPPLRERMEDAKIIAYFYFNKYSKLFNKKIVGINSDVWDILCGYDWPDNVRELQNTVEFMLNMMNETGIISKECIPKKILKKSKNNKISSLENKELNLKKLEIQAINSALEIYGNTTKGKKKAADSLGIGIATLYRKIEEYNLQE